MSASPESISDAYDKEDFVQEEGKKEDDSQIHSELGGEIGDIVAEKIFQGKVKYTQGKCCPWE